MTHQPTLDVLLATLAHMTAAPADAGRLEQVVARPAVDERAVLDVAELSTDVGLVGDSWSSRAAEPADPERQLTLMNARAADAVAGGDRSRWGLAGDQLYVDLDLSEANLPAGSRLSVGEAVVEISAPPHRGCKKFSGRFGVDGLRFVNEHERRPLRLRGANARVVVPGRIRSGDAVEVVHRPAVAVGAEQRVRA